MRKHYVFNIAHGIKPGAYKAMQDIADARSVAIANVPFLLAEGDAANPMSEIAFAMNDFHYFFVPQSQFTHPQLQALLSRVSESSGPVVVFVIDETTLLHLPIPAHVLVCLISTEQVVHAVELIHQFTTRNLSGTGVDDTDLAGLMSEPGRCHLMVIPQVDEQIETLSECAVPELKQVNDSYGAYFHVPVSAAKPFNGVRIKAVGAAVRSMCHQTASMISSWAPGEDDDAPALVMFFPYRPCKTPVGLKR